MIFNEKIHNEIVSLLGEKAYSDTAHDLIAEIERARRHFKVLGDDIGTATVLAHRLSGGAAMIGLSSVNQLFSSAEIAGKSGAVDRFKILIEKFYHDWPEIKLKIEAQLTKRLAS